MSANHETVAVRSELYDLVREISDVIPASPEPTEALLEDVIRLLRKGVKERMRLAEQTIERLTGAASGPERIRRTGRGRRRSRRNGPRLGLPAPAPGGGVYPPTSVTP